MSNQTIIQLGQEVLASQPFSQFIGAKLVDFDGGVVELEIPVREELLQQNKFVHGGVLSYAADNALTFAGGSALGPNVLTSEYKINYLKPAIGEKIVARARVVSAGKRQAVCQCDVFSVLEGEETLCATALGTIAAISTEKANQEK